MRGILTNTWLGGMNMDSDYMYMPDNQYIYAENVRVITNQDSSTGAICSIEGMTKDPISLDLPENEKIIGTSVIRNIAIIFTLVTEGTNNKYNKIYRVTFNGDSIVDQTVILKGRLGLGLGSEDNNDYSRLSIVTNYESEDNIKIYFTDGSSQTKVINIMDDRFVQSTGNPNVDSNGFMINPGSIDTTPNAQLSPFLFLGMQSGSLPAGKVQYAYQLFNPMGSATVISPLSGMIHLTRSNTSDDSQQYEGTSSSQSSGKACKLYTTLLRSGFTKARIYRVYYENNTDIPKIYVVDEFDISASQTRLEYIDAGNNFLTEITQEEFLNISNYQFTSKTLEKKDNRLFQANIKESTWHPEYDARAYRANKNGRVLLQSSSGQGDLSFADINTADFTTVPEEHDCINPFNSLRSSEFTDTNRYEYSGEVYQSPEGTTYYIKGGKGPNVSYKFVLSPMVMTEETRDGGYVANNVSMNIGSTRPGNQGRPVFRPEGYRRAGTMSYNQPTGSRIHNLADPYLEYRYKSHQRDEIYRYGLVLYNNKSVASPVYWIGDIRMPHASDFDYCPFYYEQLISGGVGYVSGKILGILFQVDNLPDEVTSYEIVRCDRTEEDRTIAMLVALSVVGNHSAADIDAGETGGEADTRPYIYPTYANSYLGNFNGSQTTSLPDDKIKNDYVLLISPEISLLLKESENLIDSSMYLDSLYGLASFTRREPGDDRIRGLFNADRFTWPSTGLELDTRIDGIEGIVRFGSFSQNEDHYLSMYMTTSHSGLPFVGKYYIPFTTNNFDLVGKSNADLSSVKYPSDIQWNDVEALGKYYTPLGQISFLNYPTNHFTDNTANNVTKTGIGGPCLIAHVPEISTKIPRLGSVARFMLLNNNKEWILTDYDGRAIARSSVVICNVKRDIIPYGGNTYSARSQSTYISIDSFYTNSASIIAGGFTFGGDTYLGNLDHPHSMMFQKKDANEDAYKKIFVSARMLFETSINTWLFQGDMSNRTYREANNFIDNMLQLQPTLISWHVLDEPYFVYNSAYSARPTIRKNISASSYSIDNQSFTNRILASEAKTNNEISDSWTQTRVANYIDVDSLYGLITNLKAFRNQLLFWQDQALGLASVNERSLIQDNNIGALVLGTGGILDRFDYLTDKNGSSTINDRSIVNSNNILYWYDIDKNEICDLNGSQISSLSKEKQVQSYFNDLRDSAPKSELRDSNSFFDFKYNEVYFRHPDYVFGRHNYPGVDISLIFNEQLARFTSFYTIDPKHTLSFSDKLIGINKAGDYNYFNKGTRKSNLFYDTYSTIRISVNQNSIQTKVFDNVDFDAYFLNDGAEDINVFINPYFHTKRLFTFGGDGTSLDHREDTYRFAIPRAYSNPGDIEGSMTREERMRGKFLISTYRFDGTDKKEFRIPYINTIFRDSLI